MLQAVKNFELKALLNASMSEQHDDELDEGLVQAVLEYGEELVAEGIRGFEQWVMRIVQDVGDRLPEDVLKAAYNKIRKLSADKSGFNSPLEVSAMDVDSIIKSTEAMKHSGIESPEYMEDPDVARSIVEWLIEVMPATTLQAERQGTLKLMVLARWRAFQEEERRMRELGMFDQMARSEALRSVLPAMPLEEGRPMSKANRNRIRRLALP